MRLFIVGGYVRDQLLGKPSKDRDFVVVGSTPQEMINNGFEQVGADFPVFLKNGEEYALARIERKQGFGYHGFDVDFNSSVTIEQDLSRRDLTINAMCIEVDPISLEPLTGDIIDPFNGRHDLQEGILRHVSDAFREDPLRVLRVARFALRYCFSIADETMQMMSEMVEAGELNHLTPERVYLETKKALQQENVAEQPADRFFETLAECGASDVVYGVGVCRWSDRHYWPQFVCGYEVATLDERFAFYFHGNRKEVLSALKFTSSQIDILEMMSTIEDYFENRVYVRTPENIVDMVKQLRLTARIVMFNKAVNALITKYAVDDSQWLRFVRILNIVTADMNIAVRIIAGITIDPSKKGDADIRDYVRSVYVQAVKEQLFGFE